jgi:hypothetical protein
MAEYATVSGIRAINPKKIALTVLKRRAVQMDPIDKINIARSSLCCSKPARGGIGYIITAR